MIMKSCYTGSDYEKHTYTQQQENNKRGDKI